VPPQDFRKDILIEVYDEAGRLTLSERSEMPLEFA
jgi:hypothetical protein